MKALRVVDCISKPPFSNFYKVKVFETRNRAVCPFLWTLISLLTDWSPSTNVVSHKSLCLVIRSAERWKLNTISNMPSQRHHSHDSMSQICHRSHDSSVGCFSLRWIRPGGSSSSDPVERSEFIQTLSINGNTHWHFKNFVDPHQYFVFQMYPKASPAVPAKRDTAFHRNGSFIWSTQSRFSIVVQDHL